MLLLSSRARSSRCVCTEWLCAAQHCRQISDYQTRNADGRNCQVCLVCSKISAPQRRHVDALRNVRLTLDPQSSVRYATKSTKCIHHSENEYAPENAPAVALSCLCLCRRCLWLLPSSNLSAPAISNLARPLVSGHWARAAARDVQACLWLSRLLLLRVQR